LKIQPKPNQNQNQNQKSVFHDEKKTLFQDKMIIKKAFLRTPSGYGYLFIRWTIAFQGNKMNILRGAVKTT
jgi:hypothetical protein